MARAMKTALVTGSAGFVGSHLVPRLQAEGYDTWCVDPREKVSERSAPCRFEDFGSRVQSPFDLVVHLAAHIPDVSERMMGDLAQYQDIALDWAMAKYLEAHPPRECAVWPSSCAVDNPRDPYAFCKMAAERFAAALHYTSKADIVILRPFSGYGWGQSLAYPFPSIFQRALEHQDPLQVWGSGEQVRDFIHVSDLVEAFIWAIKKAPRGTPIEIGTGVPTKIWELAYEIAKEVGYFPEIKSDPSKPESSVRRVANTAFASKHGFEAKMSLKMGIADYRNHALMEKHETSARSA